MDHGARARYQISDRWWFRFRESFKEVAKPITRRDYKATYRDIEYLITLDGEDRLERIFYVDSLDNRVKILFKGMKYNVLGFRSSHLECPAEPNYDVIEE